MRKVKLVAAAVLGGCAGLLVGTLAADAGASATLAFNLGFAAGLGMSLVWAFNFGLIPQEDWE